MGAEDARRLAMHNDKVLEELAKAGRASPQIIDMARNLRAFQDTTRWGSA